MKKILSLILALALCLSIFAGCGSSDSNASTNGPVGNLELVTAKNSEIYPLSSDKTFTVFMGGREIDGLYADILWEETTGVDIDWVAWDKPTMQLALTNDEFTDASMLHSRLSKTQVYEYGSAGKFINFMDYLNIMPNVRAMFEKYPEALELVKNEDGTVYALPMVNWEPASVDHMIMFRTDMLTAAGWDKAPETVDEFLECIVDIQEIYGKDDPTFQAFNAYRENYMAWNTDTGSSNMMQVFFPAFGELVDTALSVNPEGKIVFGASTEQFKNTLIYLNKIWESGAMGTDIYTEDGTVSRSLLMGNKIASSLYMEALTVQNFESGKMELSACGPFTSEYYSEKHAYSESMFTWQNNMISTACSDIVTMCKWMDSFYAPEENPLNADGTIWGQSLSYGVYGVDWTKDEETMTYKLLDHEGFDNGSAWKSAQMIGNPVGGFKFNYVLDDDSARSLKGFANIEIRLPYEVERYNIEGLNLNEDERDIYADYWTAIDTYMVEMTAKFITGDLDVEAEWAGYLEQLEILGLKDVIDAYQAAYDRFAK